MNRRRFIQLAAAATTTAAALPRELRAGQTRGAPAIITSERLRPIVTSGVQCGDVTAERAIVWSRADRSSRMVVEHATNDAMRPKLAFMSST